MTVDEIMYTVDSYADGEMREGYYGGLRSMIESGIKAAIQEAVLAEREACAVATEAEHVGEDVCDDCDNPVDEGYNLALRHAAEAIRSRGAT